MANDCLVKKYKGSSSNDNLPKFGVLRLQSIAEPSKGQFSNTKASESLTFKASANIFSSGQTNEVVAANVTKPSGQNIAFIESVTPYVLEISDKYTLKQIEIPKAFNSYSLSDFEACDILESLTIDGSGNPNININSLGLMKSLTSYTMSRTNIKGTINTLVETFVHTYPNIVKNLKLNLYLCSGTGAAFNGQAYATSSAGMIAFNAGTAIVYADEAMTTPLGSYDGTTWSYNS